MWDKPSSDASLASCHNHIERGDRRVHRITRTGAPHGHAEKVAEGERAGLVEYALILSTIAILLIIILTWLGQVVFSNLYSKIGSGMQQAGG